MNISSDTAPVSGNSPFHPHTAQGAWNISLTLTLCSIDPLQSFRERNGIYIQISCGGFSVLSLWRLTALIYFWWWLAWMKLPWSISSFPPSFYSSFLPFFFCQRIREAQYCTVSHEEIRKASFNNVLTINSSSFVCKMYR